MDDSLSVALLADRPQALSVVAAWEHAEWGHLMPEVSLDQIERAFRKRANRDRVPMTLLGYVGEELVGTASLVAHDMSIRRELSPWLAVVYVDPARRKAGIGSALVRGVMDRAAELGFGRIHLFTPDQMAFYERLGWEVLETVSYRGEEVAVMVCRLASEPA